MGRPPTSAHGPLSKTLKKVSVKESIRERLDNIAVRQRKTMGEVIRDAIRAYRREFKDQHVTGDLSDVYARAEGREKVTTFFPTDDMLDWFDRMERGECGGRSPVGWTLRLTMTWYVTRCEPDEAVKPPFTMFGHVVGAESHPPIEEVSIVRPDLWKGLMG